MKKYYKVLFFALLTSCSSLDLTKIAPGYIGAYEAIKVLLVGYKNDNITPELINNIPYASMTMSVGRGPKGLMILESKTFTRCMSILYYDHSYPPYTRCHIDCVYPF